MVIDAAKVSAIDCPTAQEVDKVAALLGRSPEGGFEVVVVNSAGEPVVIRNGPIMDNGRPMPTRYWLVDRELCRLVARLEGDGGVKAAEEAVDWTDLERAHAAMPRSASTFLLTMKGLDLRVELEARARGSNVYTLISPTIWLPAMTPLGHG